jgi:hypothetical protein
MGAMGKVFVMMNKSCNLILVVGIRNYICDKLI